MKEMKSFRLLPLAIIFFVIAGCSGKSAVTEEKTDTTQLVKVQAVSMQPVDQVKEFSGSIEAFVKNSISSPMAQRIDKIMVEVGDKVQKGQLLVQMDRSSYAQANIQLENLKVDFARIEALYKSGGASKQQYDQMKAQIDVMEQSVKNLDENTKLLSPISGVVAARNFDNGDVAGGQPILQVMQINPVKLRINISEEYFPRVKQGMPVEILADVYSDEVFHGKISLIYPTIDPTTRTFTAEVNIDNNNTKIRPGMFARARVNFGAMERIVIPDKAVVKQQGTNDKYTFVLNGDKVNYVQIELGERNGTTYEVLSGLNAGDQVVVAGSTRLVDQTKVKVQNETVQNK